MIGLLVISTSKSNTSMTNIPFFFKIFLSRSLFPMMPRHNLYKIQAEVKQLCQKYHIPYIVKPMGQAFLDILL